jgi:hypothetical protein
MHVEPLEKLPRSVREFASHYAMIVLSILTALALEQAAMGLEHRHEAERARTEIDQEIASNRAQVEQSLKAMQGNAKTWEALLQRTVAQVRSGESTNDSRLSTLADAAHQFGDSLPQLKTTAWDAALSDHSVNYLDHADLTRYSELYASQRFFSQAMWDTVRDSAMRNLTEISLPGFTGKADPVATIGALNSRARVLEVIVSQLIQLDVAMKASARPH